MALPDSVVGHRHKRHMAIQRAGNGNSECFLYRRRSKLDCAQETCIT